MIIPIKRFDYTALSSISKMDLNGKNYMILEDTVRNEKIYGETAISTGRYPLTLVKYGKLHDWLSIAFRDIYKGVIMLNNVPNYKGVCYHPGRNRFSTLGCLLPAMTVQKIANLDGSDEFVTTKESTYQAYRETYPIIVASIMREKTYFDISNECDLSLAQSAGVLR